VNIEDKAIDLHRVEYDIVSAQRKMTDFNFPEILIERLAAGR
jgi:hypothetical protein